VACGLPGVGQSRSSSCRHIALVVARAPRTQGGATHRTLAFLRVGLYSHSCVHPPSGALVPLAPSRCTPRLGPGLGRSAPPAPRPWRFARAWAAARATSPPVASGRLRFTAVPAPALDALRPSPACSRAAQSRHAPQALRRLQPSATSSPPSPAPGSGPRSGRAASRFGRLTPGLRGPARPFTATAPPGLRPPGAGDGAERSRPGGAVAALARAAAASAPPGLLPCRGLDALPFAGFALGPVELLRPGSCRRLLLPPARWPTHPRRIRSAGCPLPPAPPPARRQSPRQALEALLAGPQAASTAQLQRLVRPLAHAGAVGGRPLAAGPRPVLLGVVRASITGPPSQLGTCAMQGAQQNTTSSGRTRVAPRFHALLRPGPRLAQPTGGVLPTPAPSSRLRVRAG